MRSVRKADILTTSLCRCHEIWETLTSWKPLSHSRPVTRLLYLLQLKRKIRQGSTPWLCAHCLSSNRLHGVISQGITPCVRQQIWYILRFCLWIRLYKLKSLIRITYLRSNFETAIFSVVTYVKYCNIPGVALCVSCAKAAFQMARL
jgi:hypothetical protein